MIEIGITRLVVIKTKDKRTGKLVPKKGADGKPEQKLKEASVWRVTRNTLGGHFGCDHNRKLVVGLVSVDQIVFRPQGTRQEVRLNVTDAYRIALHRKANLVVLERARNRKLAKQHCRESAAIARADRRLREEARRDTN
jgi:hypothetical protein